MDNCDLGSTPVVTLFTNLWIEWIKQAPPFKEDRNSVLLQYPGNSKGILPNLSHLSLNSNPIGIRAIKFIAMQLKKNEESHSLRVLNLKNTMGGAGYKDLCEALISNKRLLHIGLTLKEWRQGLQTAVEAMSSQDDVLASISAMNIAAHQHNGNGDGGNFNFEAQRSLERGEGEGEGKKEERMKVTADSLPEKKVLADIEAPLETRVAFLSVLKGQQNREDSSVGGDGGEQVLTLPVDAIKYIFDFMRPLVKRRVSFN